MNEDLLSVSQVALLKRVSRNAVYKAIQEGRLNSQFIAGHFTLRRADVEAWVPRAHTGRRKGTPATEEVKAKIAESQRLRWQRKKQQEN